MVIVGQLPDIPSCGQVGDQQLIALRKHARKTGRITPVERVFNLALRIIAEGVQPMLVAEIEAEVAEEFIVVLHVRCAPDLGRGFADKGVTVLDQAAGIVALHAAAGRIGVGELKAEVGKTGLGQRQADVGRYIRPVAVAVVVLPQIGLQAAALGRVAQHEIQHPGYRVGPILRAGSVAQDFHPFEGDGRDGGDIRPVRTARQAITPAGNRRGAVAAFAVDQHQGRVRRQAAQLGRADQGGLNTDAILKDLIGRDGRGQQVVHIRAAVVPETVSVNDVYRHGRIRRGAARRAGADHPDFFKADDLFCRVGRLRPGRQRADQDQEQHQQE